jgi:ribosomal protein S18 acetylase RimI-like enzyme
MICHISPATSQDIPAIIRVELEAFRSHPRTPMMWRDGYTDDVYAFMEAKKREKLSDPDGRVLKAVDAATGQIVGASDFRFALDPARNAQRRPISPDAPPPRDWPRGGHWELRRFFDGNSEELERRSFAGLPYMGIVISAGLRRRLHLPVLTTDLVLNYLVVDPQHQGKGVGKKLLARVVEEADRRGVRLGLESTPAGLALYKKFGFEEEEVIKADMRKFGWDQEFGEDEAKRVWMIRQPSPAEQ